MLERLLAMLSEWEAVFPQERTVHNAIRQAISALCVPGRKTITHNFILRGQAQEPAWSDYKLFARSPWDEQELFTPMTREALARIEGELIGCGADDVRIHKTGKKIATAGMGRDPLSPPFYVNLMRGLRFVHTSVMLPLEHNGERIGTMATPIWFDEAPPVKRPKKGASADELEAYKQAKKQQTVSRATHRMLVEVRQRLTALGAGDKTLVCALDGSLANRTTMREPIEGVELIGRVRKESKLCHRHEGGGRRIYSEEKFTPEQVRLDDEIAWRRARIHWAGAWREIEYKQVDVVLWQGATGQRELCLLVIAPIPYRTTKNGEVRHREPGYLLCTVSSGDMTPYLQIYFDRWQVEVVHRDLKTTMGVGEAQVRATQSVPRQPVLHVATYSALRLSALICYGATRDEAIYGRQPRWQREKLRASCQDILRRIRHEAQSRPDLLAPYGFEVTAEAVSATAVR